MIERGDRDLRQVTGEVRLLPGDDPSEDGQLVLGVPGGRGHGAVRLPAGGAVEETPHIYESFYFPFGKKCRNQ